MRSFLKRHITVILWLVAFLYTFPVYNKYWAPFDEGIITVAAQMLLKGEIPYKDFFIVMYPPGQIYVLAAIFKIFSSSIIAGRLYAVSVSVVSTMLVFAMTRMLTKNPAISFFSYILALTSFSPRLGAIPTPIWPGVCLSLLSIYLFMRYLENPGPFSAFAVGILDGIAIGFRHDIGIFAFIAIFSSLSIRVFRDRAFRDVISFLAGVIIAVFPWVTYFVMSSASKDLYDSLIGFTFIHQKLAAIPFPKPCLDLNAIFHGSLHFININQFYIPIIVYGVVAILLAAGIYKRSRYDEKTSLSLLTILVFGILTFNQARIRTDPAHLLTVIGPAIVLSGFILYDTFSARAGDRFKSTSKYMVSALILMLFALLLVKNIDKYVKNAYTKVYKSKIIKTVFDKGAIYLPAEERDEVLDTIKFIKANTGPSDRIFVGNAVHWKDDFGGSLILYYLADRLPATKYYEFLPGLITKKDVQEEMAESLEKHNVKLLVLQDIELPKVNIEDIPVEKRILDDYIRKNYVQVEKFGKYNIYKRK